MLRVMIYLKSGGVAEFEAEAIMEANVAHPKFRLDFPAAENGKRRLAYLDRDDVSAVVVEDVGEGRHARMTAEEAVISLPAAVSGVPVHVEDEVISLPVAPNA